MMFVVISVFGAANGGDGVLGGAADIGFPYLNLY